MGTENLIYFNKLTQEEHRKIAIQGGLASVKARREKKELKEKLIIALDYITKIKADQAKDENLKNIIQEIGFDSYIVLKEIEKGNLNAVDRVWDRIYGKAMQPSETNITGAIATTELSDEDFKKVLEEYARNNNRQEGGGSKENI